MGAARSRESPTEGRVPHVDLTLPDGTRVGREPPEVHPRLSALLGPPVSPWPLRPARDTAHDRRA